MYHKMTKKILFVMTSHDQLSNSGQQTGTYAEEVAEPATILTELGYEIVYATPRGGPAPIDHGSIEAAKDNKNTVAFLNNPEIQRKINNTHKIDEFVSSAAEFEAVVYPGGYGPMFDLENNVPALNVTASAYNAGKVVAAICHGVIALTEVRVADGTHLVKGRNVTAISNDEERAHGTEKYMHVLVEDKLKALGAHYEKAGENWAPKVVIDGRLVTGENPASAPSFAKAIHLAITSTSA
ncbi:hypothetical protein FBU30_004643 [Linnemannia zychae]|nr:hypothetical protein FBU30_004643 [Linnemannia zychae]